LHEKNFKDQFEMLRKKDEVISKLRENSSQFEKISQEKHRDEGTVGSLRDSLKQF